MTTDHRSIVNPLLLSIFLLIGGGSLVLLVTPYFAFAPLPPLILALVFVLARKPVIGYYMILFAVPLDQYRTLTTQFPSLTISKFIGILLVIVLLVRMVIRKEAPPLRSSLLALVCLFGVVNLLSLIFSVEAMASINGLRQLITSFVFFGITLILVHKNVFFGVLPKIIVISVCLGSLLSLYGYFFDNPMFAMNVASEDIKRGIGAANNPNHFAMTLLFAIPFLVHYVLAYNLGRWRLLATVLLPLAVLALVLTFSRGAALNFAFMLALLLFEHKRYLRPKTIGFFLSGTIAALLLALLFTPASYWERQRSMIDTTDPSVSRRIDYIKVSWESFLDAPLLGTGPDSYRYLWEEAVNEGRINKGSGEYLMRYAHNTYLEVLSGSGILGLLLFFSIVMCALRSFYKAQAAFVCQGETAKASLVGAYKISFISILVYFLMLSSQFHKYFWISLAFSQLALIYSERRGEEP